MRAFTFWLCICGSGVTIAACWHATGLSPLNYVPKAGTIHNRTVSPPTFTSLYGCKC